MDWNHGPYADLPNASPLGQSSSHVIQHLPTWVDSKKKSVLLQLVVCGFFFVVRAEEI